MGYETPFAIILGAAFAGMFLNAFLGNRISTIIINPLIIAGVIVLFLLLITARRYGGPSHIKLGYGFLATLMNVLATAFLTFKMGLSKKSPSEPNDLLDEPNSLRDLISYPCACNFQVELIGRDAAFASASAFRSPQIWLIPAFTAFSSSV